MKGGAQTAVAIGVGYYLGRRRKMRAATALALGAATGGLGRLGPVALKRGAKLLSNTDIAGSLGPQVNEIVETMRGDLLDAGKAAATAAVTNRLESFADNLHTRAETLRNPEAAVSEVGETVSGAGEAAAGAGKKAAGSTLGRLRRRGRPAEEPAEEEEAGGEEERPNGRSRREASRPRRRAREPEDEYEEEEEEEEPADEYAEDEGDEEEEPEEPEPPRRRASRSPVTRTRR
jgi:hypothetical protein